MPGWGDELFFAMDDLIESLTDVADSEELTEAAALSEIRERLELYRSKWRGVE